MFPFPQLLLCYLSKEEDTYFQVISLIWDTEGGIVINLIYILEHFEVLFQRQSRQMQVTEEKKKKVNNFDGVLSRFYFNINPRGHVFVPQPGNWEGTHNPH